MAELLTAEVLAAALGLLTVVATGVGAWYRARYGEAAEQGDLIMASARRVWDVVKALGAGQPKAAPYLEKGEMIIAAMEKGWNDSKVRTPEMEDYYGELLKLAAEVGTVLAE
ncbi:MAG: hypothetical protein JET69_05510 [Methanomassiliicoccales archaeon]|nr:hypothetical protein [Methanomassiliicoccales archaeon]